MMKTKKVLLASVAAMLLLTACGAEKTKIIDLKSLNAPGTVIGAPQDYAAARQVGEYLPNVTMKYFINTADAVAAIESNKIDGFIYDRCNLDYMVQANSKIAVLPDSMGDLDICAATAFENKELMSQLNEFIKNYQDDGTAQDMYERWILSKNHMMPTIEPPEYPAKKLKVITSGEVEPMTFYKGNELWGNDIEFTRRFALEYGYEIEFVVMDYSGMPEAIRSGKGDCIIADLFYGEERAEQIWFSEPYIKTQLAVLVNRSRLQ